MGADKEIKALCYTLLSSGGHTCDLSCLTKASFYPAWKSSHDKKGSTDIMLLKRHQNPDDNMGHRKLVRNQKLFSFQQVAIGVLHISSWNHKITRQLERVRPLLQKSPEYRDWKSHRAEVCATVTALLLQLLVPPKSLSQLLSTHSSLQKPNYGGQWGPASTTSTSWNMRS